MTDLPSLRLSYCQAMNLDPHNGIPGRRCMEGDYDQATLFLAHVAKVEADAPKNLQETRDGECN
jgi:hypothetical protein